MNALRTAFRGLTMATRLLLAVAIVATALAAITLTWLRCNFPLPSDEALRVEYLEQYVGALQVIGVGVVGTLVSVIIPLMLPEARDLFERYKESRLAYSRAKTAVIYLPDRVVRAKPDEAFLLVEEAHRQLHFAETFEDVIIAKGYLQWFKRPDLWLIYNYWQIVAVAKVMRRVDWSASENRDTLRNHLHATLAVVHERFGEKKRGENCGKEKWDIADGSRFEKEDELDSAIDEKIKSIAAAPAAT